MSVDCVLIIKYPSFSSLVHTVKMDSSFSRVVESRQFCACSSSWLTRSGEETEAPGTLYLTDLREGDQDDLVQCFQTDEVSRTTLRIPYPYYYDDATFWINHCLEQTKQSGILWFFAIRTEQGRVIGAVSINEIVDGVAEIGYWLSPRYWGQGIMPLCLSTFCDFLEENSHRYEPEIVRLEAHIFRTNSQSQRVVEKCGFDFDGEILNHCSKDGVLIDMKRYGRQLNKQRAQTDTREGSTEKASS
jgi:[ribosomal protein S5]-alanine N-acetyltransferase